MALHHYYYFKCYHNQVDIFIFPAPTSPSLISVEWLQWQKFHKGFDRFLFLNASISIMAGDEMGSNKTMVPSYLFTLGRLTYHTKHHQEFNTNIGICFIFGEHWESTWYKHKKLYTVYNLYSCINHISTTKPGNIYH